MRVYKTKWFARFAKRERISDEALCEAIERAEQGLIDADLGGGLIKQRVARLGGGKSGGYRTIVAYRAKNVAIFLSAFAKERPGEHWPWRSALIAVNCGNLAKGG